MHKKNDRILLVDDEQSVLDGLYRQHRKHFQLERACGSEAALKAVTEGGPFAVVVTDFNMPGMNGTQFLEKAREHDPNMIRVMLTGQADLQTAIDAVNCGNIFRFLSKPCESETLRACLTASLDQFRLRNMERDMLEQTVRGSIEVLMDVMALSNPTAFGKATRIRDLVRQIVGHLKLSDGWQYETAALLSQIGYVAVPDDVLDRMVAGETLPDDERAMLDRHPDVARDLLKKIPRLQGVAEIVSRQYSAGADTQERNILLGGRMLAAAVAFEELVSVGASRVQAITTLRKEGKKYDKGVLEALASAKLSQNSEATELLAIRHLRVGMVIQEDVRNAGGGLIVSGGHEITEGSLQRLRNYAELGQLGKIELRVRRPQESGEVDSVAAPART